MGIGTNAKIALAISRVQGSRGEMTNVTPGKKGARMERTEPLEPSPKKGKMKMNMNNIPKFGSTQRLPATCQT